MLHNYHTIQPRDFRTEMEYLASKKMMEQSSWWTSKSKDGFKAYIETQWMSELLPKVPTTLV